MTRRTGRPALALPGHAPSAPSALPRPEGEALRVSAAAVGVMSCGHVVPLVPGGVGLSGPSEPCHAADS